MTSGLTSKKPKRSKASSPTRTGTTMETAQTMSRNVQTSKQSRIFTDEAVAAFLAIQTAFKDHGQIVLKSELDEDGTLTRRFRAYASDNSHQLHDTGRMLAIFDSGVKRDEYAKAGRKSRELLRKAVRMIKREASSRPGTVPAPSSGGHNESAHSKSQCEPYSATAVTCRPGIKWETTTELPPASDGAAWQVGNTSIDSEMPPDWANVELEDGYMAPWGEPMMGSFTIASDPVGGISQLSSIKTEQPNLPSTGFSPLFGSSINSESPSLYASQGPSWLAAEQFGDLNTGSQFCC